MKDSGKFLFLDPLTPEVSAQEGMPDDPVEALALVTDLLEADGFNPVTQLAGYLIAEDPTYLSEETEGGLSARSIAHHIGRDKLLEALIEQYLTHRPHNGEAHP